MNFDSLFVDPRGRTSRAHFVPALIVLTLVVLFYAYIVKGRTAQFCLLTLLYPALMLHARRLHDMGRGALLLIVPAVLVVAMFAVRLKYVSFGAQVDGLITPVVAAVCIAVALWACVGKSEPGANRFGALGVA